MAKDQLIFISPGASLVRHRQSDIDSSFDPTQDGAVKVALLPVWFYSDGFSLPGELARQVARSGKWPNNISKLDPVPSARARARAIR